MTRISPAVRISLGLALLTAVIVFAAGLCGLIPDRSEAVLDKRAAVCELLAVQCSVATRTDATDTIQRLVHALAGRNPDVVSAAVRSRDGTVLAEVGDHRTHWPEHRGETSTPTHVQVPIFKGQAHWGTVEVCFTEVGRQGILGFLAAPGVMLAVFVSAVGFFGYLLLMRRVLQGLRASSVIPPRVQSALDTLAEGVLLLDTDERIVLANAAFAQSIGCSADALVGRKASELGWAAPETRERPTDLPWLESLRDCKGPTRAPLALSAGPQGRRCFRVNAAPVLDNLGRNRGALAAFDDVTELETKNHLLQEALEKLDQCQQELSRRNQELQILATHDPLTGCLNRRSLFERLETEMAASHRHEHDLSCVMVDVDHLKSVNDQYGNAAGDRVLRTVAKVIQAMLRTSDALCRYGGDEFCILLPYTGIEEATKAAERLREAVQAQDCSGVRVTVSLGVSSVETGVVRPQELIDQADQALRAATKGGCNRVACYDGRQRVLT